MISFIISLAVICSNTILIDKSGEGWNKDDNIHIEEARQGCERNYGPEFKCLKTLTKIEKNNYAAICGAPSK